MATPSIAALDSSIYRDTVWCPNCGGEQTFVAEYPDGWALSLSSPSLLQILRLCPTDVRIGAWCKSFCAFKRGVRPAYAWEPVIYRGGRNPVNGYRAVIPPRNGKQVTPKDFIVAPITLQKGLVGAKPEKVCRWILELLNVRVGDVLDDLFPGTGVMGKVAHEFLFEVPGAGQLAQVRKVKLDLKLG